jgi:hypothetical protein
VEARAVQEIATAAVVDVSAPGLDGAWAEYGTSQTYGEATPAGTAAGSGAVRLVLLGLRPAAVTHLKVNATVAGKQVASEDITVKTGKLPADFPSWQVTRDADLGDHLVFSALSEMNGMSYCVMTDRHGRLFWYSKMGVAPALGLHCRRLKGGNFLLYNTADMEFRETDAAGGTVFVWSAKPPLMGVDGHDFLELPGERLLLMGLGGDKNTFLYNNIYVSDRAGNTTQLWRTAPYEPESDPVHPNSFSATADGNFIVSMRTTSQIIKMGIADGREFWRLGGSDGMFDLRGDPAGGFCFQHSSKVLAGGDILLFDNGNCRSPAYSRIVQYRLDENAYTADMVWEYRRPGTYSPVGGSVQRLKGGGTLSAWCSVGIMDEVDSSGNPVWEMRLTPGYVYNATSVEGLYP